MAVIINKESEMVVAFRCEKHSDVPQLNLSVPFEGGHASECGICCIDQGADALLASIGELIDKAAQRLEFFEPGTGQQLKEDAAKYFANLSTITAMKTAEAEGVKKP